MSDPVLPIKDDALAELEQLVSRGAYTVDQMIDQRAALVRSLPSIVMRIRELEAKVVSLEKNRNKRKCCRCGADINLGAPGFDYAERCEACCDLFCIRCKYAVLTDGVCSACKAEKGKTDG